jgi:hypothetical protein
MGKQENPRDLFVNMQKEQNKSDYYQVDHSKGKLYRGNSWKYD